MPAKITKSGMLVTSCEVCGSTRAPNGHGVNLRSGKLGMWFCDRCNDAQARVAERLSCEVDCHAPAGLAMTGKKQAQGDLFS